MFGQGAVVGRVPDPCTARTLIGNVLVDRELHGASLNPSGSLLHEFRVLLGEAWVYSTVFGGLVQYGQPLTSTTPPPCSSRREQAPAGSGPLIEGHQEPSGHHREPEEGPIPSMS